MSGRRLAPEKLSILHPDGSNRIGEPANQRAPFKDDVRPQQHIGLKRYLLIEGVDVGFVYGGDDLICGLGKPNRSAGISARQYCLRNFYHATGIRAEVLVGKRVVEETDRLSHLDTAY